MQALLVVARHVQAFSTSALMLNMACYKALGMPKTYDSYLSASTFDYCRTLGGFPRERAYRIAFLRCDVELAQQCLDSQCPFCQDFAVSVSKAMIEWLHQHYPATLRSLRLEYSMQACKAQDFEAIKALKRLNLLDSEHGWEGACAAGPEMMDWAVDHLSLTINWQSELLEQACEDSNHESIKWLTDRGAQLETASFSSLISLQRLDLIDLKLAQGEQFSWYELRHALPFGIDYVQALLTRGAVVDQDSIYRAIESGSTEMAKFLLSQPQIECHSECLAFLEAAAEVSLEMCKLVYSLGIGPEPFAVRMFAATNQIADWLIRVAKMPCQNLLRGCMGNRPQVAEYLLRNYPMAKELSVVPEFITVKRLQWLLPLGYSLKAYQLWDLLMLEIEVLVWLRESKLLPRFNDLWIEEPQEYRARKSLESLDPYKAELIKSWN